MSLKDGTSANDKARNAPFHLIAPPLLLNCGMGCLYLTPYTFDPSLVPFGNVSDPNADGPGILASRQPDGPLEPEKRNTPGLTILLPPYSTKCSTRGLLWNLFLELVRQD
ncbi:hypothetical protein JTE90_021442 [Oedothorax gibbosus]|uniref:Uncharacterized protein n=1 Tax=Oedothorax gibbosus TaxID=931172 RepID=A0AAV6VY28_9ARAC|nr:hypothetical protein JTE90_021442 [Oedothorax gibbosus]